MTILVATKNTCWLRKLPTWPTASSPVDLPPADPTDPQYFQDLEAKLLIEWALQRPVFNASVLAANSNSVAAVDSRKVASNRISKFMEKVRGICTRAPAVADHLRSGHVNAAMQALHGPGIPVDGYTMKATLSLWCSLGVSPLASFIGIDYPMGSGPVAALSSFVGFKYWGILKILKIFSGLVLEAEMQF